MPKFRLQVVNDQILAEIFVCKQEDEGNENPVAVKAMIDTGAMQSCITSDLARELALELTSRTLVAGVHGVKECNAYMLKIRFAFPAPGDESNLEIINEVEVYEVDDNPDWKMIVGMDIIQNGILIVEGDRCVFSL
jgi:hypothetical protein